MPFERVNQNSARVCIGMNITKQLRQIVSCLPTTLCKDHQRHKKCRLTWVRAQMEASLKCKCSHILSTPVSTRVSMVGNPVASYKNPCPRLVHIIDKTLATPLLSSWLSDKIMPSSWTSSSSASYNYCLFIKTVAVVCGPLPCGELQCAVPPCASLVPCLLPVDAHFFHQSSCRMNDYSSQVSRHAPRPSLIA